MACDDSNGLVQSPSRNQLISPPGSPAAAPPITSKQRQRLRSLDTFRGISIVVMIFVNDRGGDYFFFEHATWDGLYVADLVFPWFLWIMGVCIPIAIKSQLKKGTPRLKIFTAIVIRSVKLIGLGVILNSRWGVQFGEGANLRIPGILHRFGVCYLVCATLVLISMSVDIAKPEGNKIKAAIQDIGKLWVSWIIVLLILLAHCLLTFLLPIEENCPKGYLGPGVLHNNALVDKNCTGGAAGYLDREIFTSKHIYQSPTSRTVYNSEAYDPEGFLGTLTSIVQVWIGVQAGVTMMVYPRASSRLIRWGVWAVVTGGLGALLCGAKQNEGWIPVNKNLWSLSFVLVTTSFAFILLSALYIIIDIKKWWSGSPLFEPGMNSIFLYLGHSIFYAALPWHWRIGRMATHFMNVTEALWGTSLWVLTAIWLHREKWYWSL
jgi:heparan-alpha-glucosaminide N-acetyltransferase